MRILKFDEFINESYLKSNHAPLYHKTTPFSLIKILDEDTLNLGFYNNPYKEGAMKIVSLSRNKKLDISDYKITDWFTTLVFDRNELVKHYKIIPYDFFIHGQQDSNPKWSLDRIKAVEFEEIITKNIKNLGRYLISIDFETNDLNDVLEYETFLKNYLEKYSHIKINYKNGEVII